LGAPFDAQRRVRRAARMDDISERSGVFVDITGVGKRRAPKRSLNDSTPA